MTIGCVDFGSCKGNSTCISIASYSGGSLEDLDVEVVDEVMMSLCELLGKAEPFVERHQETGLKWMTQRK